MSRAISVGYKCRCMQREVECGVRGRKFGETNQQYIEGPIRAAISEDHKLRSPKCQELITLYVALPFDANVEEGFVMPPGTKAN